MWYLIDVFVING